MKLKHLIVAVFVVAGLSLLTTQMIADRSTEDRIVQITQAYDESGGDLPPEEIEEVEDPYHDGHVVAPKKYCVWTVTVVQVVVEGSTCKYQRGDKLCYRCNPTCPPGIIQVGYNYGDGCRTFVDKDNTCAKRAAGFCAGKYVGR